MTNWFRPIEKLPEHEEQVLIRQEERIDVAFYDANTETFNLRNGSVIGRAESIEWMQMLRNAAL